MRKTSKATELVFTNRKTKGTNMASIGRRARLKRIIKVSHVDVDRGVSCSTVMDGRAVYGL